MPRFFFDVRSSRSEVTHDLAGVDLPDAECAEIEGHELAKHLTGSTVEVLDEVGQMLATLFQPQKQFGHP